MNDNTIRVMQLVDENLALRRLNAHLSERIEALHAELIAARGQSSAPPGEIVHNPNSALCLCVQCSAMRRRDHAKFADRCACDTCKAKRLATYHADRTWGA